MSKLREWELDLPNRHRQRFDRIKRECHTPDTPSPTDIEIFESLMDTWDAVGDGHYSDDVECLDCGADMRMVDPPSTPGPATWECTDCHLSTQDTLWDILVQELRRK